ncbi:MAG: UDP-N-acetylmuramate dehydrogenase [bacterium]|nr:UDP-N-acetylmuramate dehydrogenase [bacterium]
MSLSALQARLGNRLLPNESLSRYTAARLGGPAEWLYIARESLDELCEVVLEAWADDLPVQVMGGGANVLVSDKGIPGLVVINDISEIAFGDWHDGRTVSATSGVNLTVFAHKCASKGFAGMEWAVSVPGTVGGAIVNNAGAHGSDTAASVADVVVLEPTGPKLYTREDLDYGYRTSTLKRRADRRFLVLLATFCLPPDDSEAIKARMAHNIDYRKRTQPPGASLGSIFKNPPGDYAGRLIEAAGLKGQRIGNVIVSPVHANFFINEGEAKAADYRALIEKVQAEVERQFGVHLEPEVEFLGTWD